MACRIVCALFFFLFAKTLFLDACTGIKLVAKDGSVVHGRTSEFGMPIPYSIAVIPRGYKFSGTTPQGPGLSYTTKYASVGTLAFGVPAIMDGINEKGLAVGTFYFPGFAGYAALSSDNQAKALSPVDFSNWVLTQFETLDELKTSLSQVVIAPAVCKGWGSKPPPFHYVVYDKAGHSLVIEPINGQLITYDNPTGVITNSPDFLWHLTNLRNYINLKTENASPLQYNGMVFAPFGQGSGMVGLPGDFTPPSRFIRATIFATSALPSPDAKKAVFQAFHILNQFDIPMGVAREKTENVVYYDFTSSPCVRDPQALIYYYKTYDDQTIKFVDLKKFDLNAKTIKQLELSGFEKAADVSARLR